MKFSQFQNPHQIIMIELLLTGTNIICSRHFSFVNIVDFNNEIPSFYEILRISVVVDDVYFNVRSYKSLFYADHIQCYVIECGNSLSRVSSAKVSLPLSSARPAIHYQVRLTDTPKQACLTVYGRKNLPVKQPDI